MEKNILIVTTTHDFLWKFERENVKILQQLGFTVHYAANENEPAYSPYRQKLETLGVQFHHIDIARSPFLLKENREALRQLIKLVEAFRIQAIHCHTPVGGLLGRLAGRMTRTPKPIVLYTAHGFHFYKGAPLWNHLAYYQAERQMARYTDIMIVINREDYEKAKKFHLKKGGRLFRIPGVGLNREIFSPFSPEEKQARRKNLGIAEDDLFLLSAGELNENKNHGAILEALAKMKRRGENPASIRYGICGDGFLRDTLRQQVKTLGLEETVEFYGYCPDIQNYLGCADALIFPSRREGLGMVGLEAMAMGVPVIAADNRGTREYLEHGKNGFVCNYDDIDGYIRGIQWIGSLSADRKAGLSRQCTETAKAFDKAHTNAIMRRIYANVAWRIESQ